MSINNTSIDIDSWDEWQDQLEERDELGKGVKKSNRKMAVVQWDKTEDKIDRTNARGRAWTIEGDS